MERFRRVSPRSLKAAAVLLTAAVLAIAFRGIVFTVAILLSQAGAAAFVLEPLSRIYEKKLSRALASLLAVLTAILIVALIGALLVPTIFGPIADLYASLPAMLSYLRSLLDGKDSVLGSIGISLESISKSLEENLNGILAYTASYFARTASTLARLVIVITVSFFMLRDREKLQLRLELVVPFRFRERVVKACSTAQRELRLYLRGQLIISLLVGAISAAGLWAAGVPAGIGLGLMTGILNIIPYFGPVIACVPVTLTALSVSLPCAIIAGAVLIIVQQIDGLVISPRIMGGVTGFSSASVIIALYAAGAVKGILGMLIALPILILIRTCIRVFVESSAGN